MLQTSYDQAARHREARRAVEKSETILHEIHERDAPVERVSESMKKIRANNHFADLILHAFKGA